MISAPMPLLPSIAVGALLGLGTAIVAGASWTEIIGAHFVGGYAGLAFGVLLSACFDRNRDEHPRSLVLRMSAKFGQSRSSID